MADISALADELANDPLGRGYSGMTDQRAADDLNTAYRTRNRSSLSGDEVWQATDATEFSGLADGSGNNADKQGHWVSFCGRSSIDPFAQANVDFVDFIFGGASTTKSSLASLRTESITRAHELGLGTVKVGHVQEAKRLNG